ncbi:MAG: LuxR C-terminal-related transcriptional regulator [Gammaproteobacteria bacterium]
MNFMTIRSLGPNEESDGAALDASALAVESQPGLNADPPARPDLPFVERRERERRKSKQRDPAPGQVVSHHINRINGGVGFSNLPDGPVDAVSATSHVGAAPPDVPALNRTSYFPCADRALTRADSNLITVLIASGRDGLLKTLSSRLASEQNIRLLIEPIEDPALLPRCVQQAQPKVLLLDTGLLDQLGPEFLRMIRTTVRRLHVLLLSDEVCSGLVEKILRHRLRGYLLTSYPPDAYVKAIRAVSRGDIWLPRGLLADVLSDLLQRSSHGDAKTESNQIPARSVDMLTKREKQIVGLLGQGLTNKEIARQLDIMEDTVKKHLQNVFDKLGVRRRTLVVLRQVAG